MTSEVMRAGRGSGYVAAMGDVHATDASFGELLRGWRERRRLTQLDLAAVAEVSTRHLSFLETGRANPSRRMVLLLAEQLELPLRERNVLLHAAGFVPAYPRRSLEATEMAPVREAVNQVLRGHEPYPAIAVDRYWNILAMNTAAGLFAEDVDPELLGPPPNAYRLSLHPQGLAPRIVNLDEVGHHLLGRLRHDAAVTADPELAALLREVETYPTVRGLRQTAADARWVVVPVRLRHPRGELALFTTVTTFGTPADVTVDELALETFFPADAETAQRLDRLGERADGAA
jgi:transcriptional regulator with XRE-family HTH domain